MPLKAPDFTIGIEEEYLLVDKDSLDLAPAPAALMEECQSELEGQVSPEFLDCQIEIGTRVCATVSDAREDLKRLRSTVARVAAKHNLAPIAASCHPFSDWRDQKHTNKDRYNTLQSTLGGVARRMLICGMHVHVGIQSRETRIDIMNQLSYFLPHLLALSGSSPFWQGDDTGLSCYRLTVFDNLPRTGLPQIMDSWSQWERSVEALKMIGVIEDSSKIWWDLRPSSKYPTLETRICDVSPRLETTLTLAALNQALARMLYRLQTQNQRWRMYDRFLIQENRWRAQRYGTSEGLIDFGKRKIVPFEELTRELIELTQEDAEFLQSTAEIENSLTIAQKGNSSEQQRRVLNDSLAAGKDKAEAMRDVVRFLTEEFHADL
ncbi:carboxylate-amine ligase [Cognatishimia sp. 1_MG-2023]|uniref:carboxylate-amine ligase n=1 Tax=Cognatishimia sp. 1_MG-2023 TaxID=3062642 RepID=UPI0026E2377E|nr:carboxylate-amine ligase [Cognatishimia sp. 1_MG-2023]MDO6727277.1 carboxylate-amine ligase [Cognatishimia sp. 1_MG-2023]